MMRQKPANALYYEQKWVFYYYGTGKPVPIDKVKEELEKRGYKITIIKDEQRGKLMRIEKDLEVMICSPKQEDDYSRPVYKSYGSIC